MIDARLRYVYRFLAWPMREFRRRLARRRWRSAQRLSASGLMWAALGLAFVAVMALGAVGFTRYGQAGGGLDPVATRVYRSLQLFVLDSGAVSGGVPWQLQVARFAAPLVAAYAIVQTLAAVFREQVASLRLQLVRGHVVVAGLGHKGARLTEALLRRGYPVVVIEVDSVNVDLDTMRAIGCLVVVGDARDARTQRRARVSRATHLVALCGDDGTNTEVVAQAREHAVERRSGTLQCVADLDDPDLCLMLCGEELERYGRAPVRTDFVSTDEAAAQVLLRAHPPFGQDEGAPPQVLVVGTGRTARHLLVTLARGWATRSEPRAAQRVGLTVVGLDRESLSALAAVHPELARFAALRTAGDARAALTTGMPRMIFVCPDDDATATATALDVRALLMGRPVHIVVVLQESRGLGRLLEGASQPDGGPTLATFGLLDEACQPEVLLTGTTELLARALHSVYLDAAAGATRSDDPSLRSWSELPETLRESNRDQAAHIAVKLAAVRRAVGPLIDWNTALDPFSDDEVEVMARLEHDRWVTERRKGGWRPGPRDPRRRTTPYLIPWEQLSEEIRDHDRMFVRELPRLLASVGLQAVSADASLRTSMSEGACRLGGDEWVTPTPATVSR